MPFYNCANECSTRGIKLPPSCEISPRDGGINRLVFLTNVECGPSEYELNLTDLEFWKAALFKCEIVVTGRLKGQKPKGAVTSEKLTSCLPEQPTGAEKSITFMDYNSYEEFEDFDFWNEIYYNQSRWLVMPITCDGRIYPASRFTIDIDEVIPEDSKQASHYDGAITLQQDGIIKPFVWPELLQLLTDYPEMCTCAQNDRDFDCNETYPGFISLDFVVPSDLVLPTIAQINNGDACQYETVFVCCNGCREDVGLHNRPLSIGDGKYSSLINHISQLDPGAAAPSLQCESIECMLESLAGWLGAVNTQFTAPNRLTATFEISGMDYSLGKCFVDEFLEGGADNWCETIEESFNSLRTCRCSYWNDLRGYVPVPGEGEGPGVGDVPCPDGDAKATVALNFAGLNGAIDDRIRPSYVRVTKKDFTCPDGFAEVTINFDNSVQQTSWYLSELNIPDGCGNIILPPPLNNYGGFNNTQLADGLQFFLDNDINASTWTYQRTGNSITIQHPIPTNVSCGGDDPCGNTVSLVFSQNADGTGLVLDTNDDRYAIIIVDFTGDAPTDYYFRLLFMPNTCRSAVNLNTDPNWGGTTATELADGFEHALNNHPDIITWGLTYTRNGNQFEIVSPIPDCPGAIPVCERTNFIAYADGGGNEVSNLDGEWVTISSTFNCSMEVEISDYECCSGEVCYELTDLDANYPSYFTNFINGANDFRDNVVDLFNNEILGITAEVTTGPGGDSYFIFTIDEPVDDGCCGNNVVVDFGFKKFDSGDVLLNEYNVKDSNVTTSPLWCCSNFDDDQTCNHERYVKYEVCFDENTYTGDPTRYEIDWGNCQPYSTIVYPLDSGVWSFTSAGGDFLTSITDIANEIETEFDNAGILDFQISVINNLVNDGQVCLEMLVPINSENVEESAYTQTQADNGCICSCGPTRRLPGYGYINANGVSEYNPLVKSDYGDALLVDLIAFGGVELSCCGCPDDDILDSDSCPQNTFKFVITFVSDPPQDAVITSISVGTCLSVNTPSYPPAGGTTASELADGFEWYLNNVFQLYSNVNYLRAGNEFVVFVSGVTGDCCTDGLFIQYSDPNNDNPLFDSDNPGGVFLLRGVECCNEQLEDQLGMCPKTMPLCIRPAETPLDPTP